MEKAPKALRKKISKMAQTNTRVIRGRIELWVPHNGSEIAFAYPSAGPNTYRNVGAEILNRKQRIPTGDETASSLHVAYCSEAKNEPEFENVRAILRNRWLWVFNRNLWTPEGVYVIQDTEAIGRSQQLNQNQLEEMLKDGVEIEGVRFSEDGKVRFAPKETYQSGEQTPKSLAKNGFVIAGYGKEGAGKLAEVSADFRTSPYVFGVETKSQEQRVSALGDSVGDWLGVLGDSFGGGVGRAFGVLE